MADRTAYTSLIQQCAVQYDLPFDLLEAQVLRESSGDPYAFRYEPNFWRKYIKNNPDALGRKYGPLAACSFGLMQIVLETALELGFDGRPEDLFVDRISLGWGAKKMQALVLWAGGEYPKALSAYNGGSGRAVGPPFPNQIYVDAIYKLAERAT